MRTWDTKLREDPKKDAIWRLAFLKARHGWAWYNAAKDDMRYGNEQGAEFWMEKAEEKLTEALQILASAGMDNGELAHHIRKTLAEMETKRVAV